MKERKCESLFSFRRSNNRYSLHLEKTNKKEADVQLKRASWSSFPLLKFSSFDERGSKEELSNAKSQSSEDVKHQPQNINTPKVGCNFLRGSTASIRSAFSSSSSSSTSSSSSSSSSPSSRSSGSSGKSSITSILEGSVSDSHYESSSTVEDNPPYLPTRYVPTESHLSRSASDFSSPFAPRFLRSEGRGTSSVPSLFGEEEEEEEEQKKMSPTSPKIVFAHKKTPDLRRKSRKQLAQEYEKMKENGSLPHNFELMTSEKEEEKENVIPRSKSARSLGKGKSNFRFMQNYKFLSKVDSRYLKRSSSASERKTGLCVTDTGEDVISTQETAEVVRQTSPDKTNVSLSGSVTPVADINPLAQEPQHTSLSSYYSSSSSSPLSSNTNSSSSSSFTSSSSSSSSLSSSSPLPSQCNASPYSVTSFLNSQFGHLLEEQQPPPSNYGSIISDIIEEEEDSECDLSEFMVHADESSCFERSLEDKLEMLGDKELLDHSKDSIDMDNKDNTSFDYNIDSLGESHLQGQSKKPDLKLNLVKPQHIALNKIYKSRHLRHISEEPDSSGGLSGSEDDVEIRSCGRNSSPGTPRSPAIDIDDVFKQKQKEIENGNKDDMSRVKDLTMRLKLATRRPSYLEWLGTVKQKSLEMNKVLESHAPLVLEEGQQDEERPSEEVRKKNLQSALCWLRQELLDMRQQDQHLARQLMQLRIELQRLRLLRSCDNHQALVDEVTNEAEEAKTFECSDLCEVPPDLRETFSPILREIGVTRMNITSRRFSLR